MERYLLPDNLGFFIGMSIVFIVSSNIFNSWTKSKSDQLGYTDPPRHYTTFIRFNLYRLFYIIIMLAIYLVLIAFPEVMVILGADITADMAKKISGQSYLWAALLISGIVPNFPVFQTWEAKLRDKLQERAFIPSEAQTIIETLENDYNSFAPQPENIKWILDEMNREKNEYTVTDFYLNRKDSLRHKWCKLYYLFKMIKKKKEDRIFMRYMGSCDKQIFHKKLEKEFANLEKDIDKRIELVEKNIQDNNEITVIESVKEQTDELLNTYLRRCYRLISCGILTTEKLPQNRKDAFRDFGLIPSTVSQEIPINWNAVLKSSMIIFGTAFFPTLLYYYYFKQFSPEPPFRIYPDSGLTAFSWSLVGLGMFLPPLVISSIIERIFWRKSIKKGSTSLFHENIICHNFLSGCIGYIMGFAVLVLYKMFREGPIVNISQSLVFFPLLPAISAALISYFMESRKDRYVKFINRRLMSSISIGLGNALCATIILLVIEDFDIQSILYVGITAALIGAGIGYTFIEGYRFRMRPEKERRKEARYLVDENAILTIDDNKVDCRLTTITPYFATVNINVPKNRSSVRLSFPPIGEIPVVVEKRRHKETILRFLFDKVSETMLNSYIHNLAGTGSAGVKNAMAF